MPSRDSMYILLWDVVRLINTFENMKDFDMYDNGSFTIHNIDRTCMT